MALIGALLVVAGCGSDTDNADQTPGCDSACMASINAKNADTEPADTEPVAAPTTEDTLGDKITAWYLSVQDEFNAVSEDQGKVADASSTGDETVVAAACSTLKEDVVTLQSGPDAPDPEVRRGMARALDAYSTAATQCLAGDYEAAGQSLTSGTGYITDVTARIKEIKGD